MARICLSSSTSSWAQTNNCKMPHHSRTSSSICLICWLMDMSSMIKESTIMAHAILVFSQVLACRIRTKPFMLVLSIWRSSTPTSTQQLVCLPLARTWVLEQAWETRSSRPTTTSFSSSSTLHLHSTTHNQEISAPGLDPTTQWTCPSQRHHHHHHHQHQVVVGPTDLVTTRLPVPRPPRSASSSSQSSPQCICTDHWRDRTINIYKKAIE